jgi:hypothetical protein
MNAKLKQLPAAFYQTANGAEPVRDWLKRLSDDDRDIIGYDISVLEFGWPIGMPLCRPLAEACGKSEVPFQVTAAPGSFSAYLVASWCCFMAL